MQVDSLDVLLVEDNPNDARLIRRHLTQADSALLPDEVTVRHEQTLNAGSDWIEQNEVDLVLLDLGLPETSGVETFHRLDNCIATTPVVVLTGLQDEQAALELLQQGAQDYLTKGAMNREALVKSVRYALERQERETEVRTTKDQLEVLNRILRHDISNDVQVLELWGERLAEQVDDEHESDLRRILRTTDRIRELTQNSREYMRIATEQSDIETELIRLDQYLREEVQKARTRYPGAEFELRDPLPQLSVAANGMLSSVFRNLLNNAVQHNEGAPHVEISVEADDESVHVSIADDGPGIPDERKAEVFGKGERGLRSEGTGIGLYIVNTVVTEFDGDTQILDNDPTGAIISLELNRAENQPF
ncbi:ATP-binding protein [Halovenus marina]|uniref:sensor histidine kinase n=1 Tax=Halovenus marina TaxID=3396621 RepID=UPI003F5460B6